VEDTLLRFKTFDAAVSALRLERQPMSLNRFEADPGDSVILAVNDALSLTPYAPHAGDHPDVRRDPNLNADVEMAYLYRVLIERGHARQVLTGHHYHLELNVRRVEIDGDSSVYGFVKTRPIRAVA
jgi:hypothetical protein